MAKRSEEFKKTQKLWYDKLKKQGFDDLEWITHESGYGQNSPFLKYKHAPFDEVKIKEHTDHYSKCAYFLNYGTFKSPLHKKIFAMYCEGVSYRNMIKRLKKSKSIKYIPSIFWISIHLNQMLNECAFFHFKEESNEEIQEESIDYIMRTNKRAF